ncbi:GntR family transcriptional regulator [Undibacterium arcticum]|uniref:GntR family transcriptional regulator n=1 Tax=Undibacterium arcticum TaxID=1762892 RepID=A0ABV7EZY4_9BURK
MHTEAIVNRITNAIFQHRLLPGAKLNERDLAAIFGVSRTLIRQALIRLAKDKLVTIEPNRGAFVARPTLEEAHHLFDALIVLEKGLIEMIGQTITTKDIAALRAHVALQQQAQSSGDLHLADELGIQFHLLLAKLIRNPVLEEIHRELMSRERVITALYKADFDYPCLLNEHHAIINHLEKGSIKRAQKVLESHYRVVIKGYLLHHVANGEIDLAEALAE